MLHQSIKTRLKKKKGFSQWFEGIPHENKPVSVTLTSFYNKPASIFWIKALFSPLGEMYNVKPA